MTRFSHIALTLYPMNRNGLIGFTPTLIWGQVPEDILIERVVGRRLDPATGKIYHLKYSPPETEAVAARLTQRFDDTEEKASPYFVYSFLSLLKVAHSVISLFLKLETRY